MASYVVDFELVGIIASRFLFSSEVVFKIYFMQIAIIKMEIPTVMNNMI